jgi:hypothetical protein
MNFVRISTGWLTSGLFTLLLVKTTLSLTNDIQASGLWEPHWRLIAPVALVLVSLVVACVIFSGIENKVASVLLLLAGCIILTVTLGEHRLVPDAATIEALSAYANLKGCRCYPAEFGNFLAAYLIGLCCILTAAALLIWDTSQKRKNIFESQTFSSEEAAG